MKGNLKTRGSGNRRSAILRAGAMTHSGSAAVGCGHRRATNAPLAGYTEKFLKTRYDGDNVSPRE